MLPGQSGYRFRACGIVISAEIKWISVEKRFLLFLADEKAASIVRESCNKMNTLIRQVPIYFCLRNAAKYRNAYTVTDFRSIHIPSFFTPRIIPSFATLTLTHGE